MARSLLSCLFAIPLCAATLSCRASYPAAPTGRLPIVALKVQYGSAMGPLAVGSVFSLRALTVDTDSVYQQVRDNPASISWISSNPTVVRVSPACVGLSTDCIGLTLFTAVGPGTADITAVHQGLTDSVSAVVRESPPQYPYIQVFLLDPSPSAGKTANARAYFYQSAVVGFQNVTDVATWNSSDSRVATVERGRVSAIAIGNVEITATFNGVSSWLRFSVSPRQQ